DRVDAAEDGCDGVGLCGPGRARASQTELRVHLRVTRLGRVDDHTARLHPAVQLLDLAGVEPVGGPGREDEQQTRRRRQAEVAFYRTAWMAQGIGVGAQNGR